MQQKMKNKRLLQTLIAAPLAAGLLAACGGGGGAGGGGGEGGSEGGDQVKLSFANSYSLEHPHNRCGTELVAEDVADAGIEIEVFPSSQLGADAQRFTSVMSGDIDMDLQGSSGLAATFAPIGVMDMAYVFNDVDHLFRWFDSEDSSEMKAAFEEETGSKILGAWYFGNRTFSANSPIRSPEDLEGLRIRFPDSPVHLANAEAMGANAVAVAFEEIYLALQQGTVDGQENPVTTVEEQSFDEVQSHVSLNEHSVGSQLVVISNQAWERLSGEQQETLRTAVNDARAENLECAQQAEQEILDQWETAGTPEVIEDVDREAFIQMSEEYFMNNLEGEQLALYENIRSSANG